MKKLLKGLFITALAVFSVAAALDFGWKAERTRKRSGAVWYVLGLCGADCAGDFADAGQTLRFLQGSFEFS